MFKRLVLVCVLAVSPAFAGGGERGDWELGAFAGHGWLGDYGSLNPDNGHLYGGRVGYFFNDYLSMEGSWQKQNSGFDIPGHGCGNNELSTQDWTCKSKKNEHGSFNPEAARLNLLANFRPGATLRPFVTAGVGIERTDADPRSRGYNAGGGLRVMLGQHANLRFEGRFVRTDDRSGWVNNKEATVGIGFLFGGGHSDAECCEGPEPSPGPAGPRGPQGPAGPQGPKGDPGPLTKPPMIEDLEAKKPVILKGVEFDHDKDTLRPDSKRLLDEVAASLKDWPKVDVQVQGHCSSPGSDAYNMDLSARRAAAVKAYLISKGVNAGRLGSIGYGESRPIADNRTKDGQARNRRVELHGMN